MLRDKNPKYKRFDFLYTQLFNWLAVKASDKDEIIEKIRTECQSNLSKIAKIVNGRFETGEVEYKNNYIRFRDLFFTIAINGNEINCVSKIRINPCIKLPLFIKEFPYDVDKANLNKLIQIFDEYSIPLGKDSIIELRRDEFLEDNIFEIISQNNKYLIRKLAEKIEVYSEQTAPYFSKILVISKAIAESTNHENGEFSEEIKERFFDEIENKSINLTEALANIYLPHVYGGAIPISNGTKNRCVHQIEIKSVASNDDRLLDLLVDKSKRFALMEKLKSNDYINNIINSLLSLLCREKIDNWRITRKPCISNAKWKLITTQDATGLYATTNLDDRSITSAVFHFKNKNHEPVYEILRSWALDLNVLL